MQNAALPADDAPTPRKQPRDARRVQLMEATIEVIARQGYSRTTLTEVAREAGLSHGLVNFHFQSKENLLVETLLYLAEEYRLNWTGALEAAGNDPAACIYAVLTADFSTEVYTPSRLSAWCAFWGEAQSRPIYQEACGPLDAAYAAQLEAICRALVVEGGYRVDPVLAARILRLVIEGTWLDMMTLQTPYPPAEARRTVMASAALCFPGHFGQA